MQREVIFVDFLLRTLFQFGLTKAPIKNAGVINAKYDNTLYGTINKHIVSTNKLNIFIVILNNIFKVVSLTKK